MELTRAPWSLLAFLTELRRLPGFDLVFPQLKRNTIEAGEPLSNWRTTKLNFTNGGNRPKGRTNPSFTGRENRVERGAKVQVHPHSTSRTANEPKQPQNTKTD